MQSPKSGSASVCDFLSFGLIVKTSCTSSLSTAYETSQPLTQNDLNFGKPLKLPVVFGVGMGKIVGIEETKIVFKILEESITLRFFIMLVNWKTKYYKVTFVTKNYDFWKSKTKMHGEIRLLVSRHCWLF